LHLSVVEVIMLGKAERGAPENLPSLEHRDLEYPSLQKGEEAGFSGDFPDPPAQAVLHP